MLYRAVQEGVRVKKDIRRRDKQQKTHGEMVAAIDTQRGVSKKNVELWEVTLSMRLAGHQSSGGFSPQTGKWLSTQNCLLSSLLCFESPLPSFFSSHILLDSATRELLLFSAFTDQLRCFLRTIAALCVKKSDCCLSPQPHSALARSLLLTQIIGWPAPLTHTYLHPDQRT